MKGDNQLIIKEVIGLFSCTAISFISITSNFIVFFLGASLLATTIATILKKRNKSNVIITIESFTKNIAIIGMAQLMITTKSISEMIILFVCWLLWATVNKINTEILIKPQIITLVFLTFYITITNYLIANESFDSLQYILGTILTIIILLTIKTQEELTLIVWLLTVNILISFFTRTQSVATIIGLSHKNSIASNGLIAISMLMCSTNSGVMSKILMIITSTTLLINDSLMGRAGLIIIGATKAITQAVKHSTNKTKKSIIAITSILVVILIINTSYILKLLQHDMTFTKRIPIWENQLIWIGLSPIIGWGSDFWIKYGTLASLNNILFGVGSGHNSFLDMAVKHGIPSAIMLAGLIIISSKTVKLPTQEKIILMLGVLMPMITETMSFELNSILGIWIIFCTLKDNTKEDNKKMDKSKI